MLYTHTYTTHLSPTPHPTHLIQHQVPPPLLFEDAVVLDSQVVGGDADVEGIWLGPALHRCGKKEDTYHFDQQQHRIVLLKLSKSG